MLLAGLYRDIGQYPRKPWRICDFTNQYPFVFADVAGRRYVLRQELDKAPTLTTIGANMRTTARCAVVIDSPALFAGDWLHDLGGYRLLDNLNGSGWIQLIVYLHECLLYNLVAVVDLGTISDDPPNSSTLVHFNFWLAFRYPLCQHSFHAIDVAIPQSSVPFNKVFHPIINILDA